ncbi:hypothetical protein BD309DRAFT_954193 [Dichomitus squalens]|nr:hypothetical protein BD309DRAFT_954193 [Dichomitus squalens]
MSDASDVQAIIADASATDVYNYCAIAALTLFVYDYLLTSDGEITLFWMPRRVNGATILFLLNRTIPLSVQILGWVPRSWGFQNAIAQDVAYNVLLALQYLPWATFSALRTYALYAGQYQWVISAVVFALSSVPLVVNMVANLHFIIYVNDPVEGFGVISTLSESTALRLTELSRFCLIGADILVLCVTWYRTHEIVRMSRLSDTAGIQTFSGTLLRDGTSYFLTLVVFNILHVTFTLTSLTSDAFNVTSVIPLFEEPLISIVTSRFLINLQRVRNTNQPSSNMASVGELEFQPQSTSADIHGFIGSLGAHMSFPGDDGDTRGEEWE